jgi:hypothetical protein
LKVAANGDVLVFDWNGMRLKRFDRDGAPITTYEVKDAVGSAALANPTDFDIAPDGSIWLADPPKGTIVVFEPTGAVRRVITLEHSASHIVHLDGSRFATLPGRTVSHLFEVRRADSVDAVNAFGEFLPDWQRDSISLSGALGGVTKEGLVVFGAYFTGLLAAFDGEGRIHYVTEAINRLPLPTIQLTSNGARRVYKDAPVAMRSLGISESHVVVSSPDDVGTALALDLYDASNGKYEYSISLPQGASRAYLAGHRLYTTTRNSVTWWTMK